MSGGWSISAENMSAATLMELYQLMKDSNENRDQAVQIQRTDQTDARRGVDDTGNRQRARCGCWDKT